MSSNDWILLPVKPFELGKGRLSAVLDPPARAALNARFFDHVLAEAIAVVGAKRCIVITRSPSLRARARARAAIALTETGFGQNTALEQGAEAARREGAERLLALSCDLPLLGRDDVAAMLSQSGDVVLASDVAGVGTNALRTSASQYFRYSFGDDSRLRHLREANRRSLKTAEISRAGLARDIDHPADLASLLAQSQNRPQGFFEKACETDSRPAA
jgi:2-phospho-L-lactate/phosphoenolpyruvate guanylyltransferase